MTEDEKIFGKGRWVYCKQHMQPHKTGWCTVPPSDKVLLGANDQKGAYAEAQRNGFEIYK